MATSDQNESFLAQAGGVIAAAMGAVMQDGMIAAAGRMGIDELGAALKAFPDSIQTQETGSIWNPTQGEVAAARRDDDVTPMVGLGDIGALPSPSEVAAETRLYQPPPEQSQGQSQDQGNGR